MINLSDRFNQADWFALMDLLILILVPGVFVLIGLLAVATPAQSQTCVGPGECPNVGTHFNHVKRIECGPWPDLPQRFVVRSEVPLGVVPLAGERGFDQTEQCDMLRRAVTGEP